MGDITRILAGVRDLDRREAMERLVPLLYDELRALARAHLARERSDHTLQATALVHEAYMRLLGASHPPWNDRRHFFRAAAEAMRRILIEHARRRGRQKRGGDQVRVELRDGHLTDETDLDQLLALDDAIRRLDEQDPRAADVVRLRYFAGLSIADTARALDLSERTVKRDWTLARAWLYKALRDDG
ncbi:MAG: ECF-type sigma factor [Gemmatimonadota bacterium]|nr:ECF-type sigma factor [Gemmatimonadota bacterium]